MCFLIKLFYWKKNLINYKFGYVIKKIYIGKILISKEIFLDLYFKDYFIKDEVEKKRFFRYKILM